MSALRWTRTPASRQPHDCRACALPAPAVERGPRHPQLGGHLLDSQQRVIRSTRSCGRGDGGSAGNGRGSRGRPVRGVATTDAPLRPLCQARPPPSWRQAVTRGCGRETEEPHGRAWRGGWRRAAASWRKGRSAGAGAESRAVIPCAPSPLPGVAAAGPAAGRRGGLACRPGPQASTLDSARRVKSARPRAAPGLTPGPEPRVDTGRHPPGQERPTPHEGRPPGGHHGSTVARTATVLATVVPRPPPPGGPVRARPAASSELCWPEDLS